MTKHLQIAVGLVTSLGLLALLARAIDASRVMVALSLIDVRTIPVAVAIYLVAMGIRSLVWKRLLGPQTTAAVLFQITVVGFAISYLLPLRLGEVARVYLLRRWSGVDYGVGLASVVAERIIDGVAVVGILLVALTIVPAPDYVTTVAHIAGALFGCLAGVLLLASWRQDLVIEFGGRLSRRLPPTAGSALDRLCAEFVRGIGPLRNWRQLPGTLALSIAGWLCQFAMFYVLIAAVAPQASFPIAVVTGAVANFATLLPSAPGFVGTFDAALVELIAGLAGSSLESAAACTLLIHTVLVIPIVTLAAVILWRADLSIAHVIRRSMSVRGAAQV
jgi:uncharacterized protein (TIRG00374 family)